MDIVNHIIRLKIIPLLKKGDILNFLLGSIDILAITLSFQFSYFINYYHSGTFFFTQPKLIKLYMIIMPIWLVILYLIEITEIPRTKRYRVLFKEYLQSAILIIILLLIIYFVFKLYLISRLFLFEFVFLGFICLLAVRILEYKVFRIYRAKGYNYVNTIIIADETSVPFIDELISRKEWGYRVFSIFTTSDLVKERYEKAIILVSEEYMGVLNDLMEGNIIDEVLYIKSKIIPSEVRIVVRSCEELGVVFSLKYQDEKIKLTNAINTNIGDEKFLTFINIPYNVYALMIKQIMDIGVSLFMVICLSPVLLTIALLIKLQSDGPVIYKQLRVGLRGRQFNLYKFRTMVANAEKLREDLEDKNEVDGPVFKIKDDPRVTKIGKFLRKTGLDELPQLFNILKGEMSLIGPRPPIPSETIQYKRWQLRRLSVKPGLSCFWQITPERNNIKFEKWMELDLAYIDNWSPRLDMLILIKTIKTVFQRTGL
jgi:exopolysaccharide biosynthesis polyprenyl glycosylphosphotransferase